MNLSPSVRSLEYFIELSRLKCSFLLVVEIQSTRCFAERGVYFETENKFVPIFIFIFENEPTISRGYNVVNDNNLNP